MDIVKYSDEFHGNMYTMYREYFREFYEDNKHMEAIVQLIAQANGHEKKYYGRSMIIVVDKEVVGFVTCFVYEEVELKVCDVFVVKGHRGKGIASSAIKKILEESGASYASVAVYSGSKASQRMLEKAGFTTVRTEMVLR